MNNVNIIGNITKDIELRSTQSGKSVANVSIAYNDGYGEKQTAHYFDVQVWEKQAENLAQYCGKGSKIGVSGKLIQQRWKHEEKNMSKVLIQAFNITFLDSKKESKSAKVTPEEVVESRANTDVFAEFADEVQLTDDDLPF